MGVKTPAVAILALTSVLLIACGEPTEHARAARPMTRIAFADLGVPCAVRTSCSRVVTFSPTGRAMQIDASSEHGASIRYGQYDAEPLYRAVADVHLRSDNRDISDVPVSAPGVLRPKTPPPRATLTLQIADGASADIVAQTRHGKFSENAAKAVRAIRVAERDIVWERDDGIAPWLGAYLGSAGFFVLQRTARYAGVDGMPTSCEHAVFTAIADDAGMHIACGGRHATLRAGVAGTTVEGDLIPPGTYREITGRLYDRLRMNGREPPQPCRPSGPFVRIL